MIRIGIDAMGGDFAPLEAIRGSMDAVNLFGDKIRITLIGDKSEILASIKEVGADEGAFDIVHADEIISYNDHPAKAVMQKKNSSIVIGFGLLKNKEIDAFAGAGNTGAMLVGAIMSIKTIEGVIRPSVTTVIPKVDGGFGVLLDVGANVDCRPDVLYQFGILGSLLCEHVYKIEKPKVGLVNIGEEKEKGNLVTQAAYLLMEESEDFNFVGNIEGRDLFVNKADVAVCDGFTGNVVLKTAESFFYIMKKRGVQDEYLDRFNYEDYGGTPILGVNAPVMIGHGISNAKAFMNMIRMSKEFVESNLIELIRKRF
ncbi:MAG: phosphate acyltransferase PlsX [Bacteroidota bacterium]|nr:phosphate acyltransferase PlsX [Bacteroidota bacterium]